MNTRVSSGNCERLFHACIAYVLKEASSTSLSEKICNYSEVDHLLIRP